jgi:hypothetical protein
VPVPSGDRDTGPGQNLRLRPGPADSQGVNARRLTRACSLLLLVAAVFAATDSAAPAGSSTRSQRSLTELQKARRFLRYVNAYDKYSLWPILDATRHQTLVEEEACDVSPPKSKFNSDFLFWQAVSDLRIAAQLVWPYDNLHGELAALRPRAAPLRTLVSSSSVQLEEARQFEAFVDPDVCALLHTWQAQQWSDSFPLAYYCGTLRQLGVNWWRMMRQRKRSEATEPALQKLGLGFMKAINLSGGVNFYPVGCK